MSFEGTEYRLSPDRLELRADIEGMVDAALDASRSGGLPTRVWRYATSGSVDREIAPQIAYSAEALDGFVNEVTERDQPPPARRDGRPLAGLAQRGARAGRRDG